MNTGSNQAEIAPELDEGAHLDAFRVADDEAELTDADFVTVDESGQAVEVDPEPGQMPREAFAAVWNTAWNLPGMMLPEYKPLQITPEKEAPSNEAADAVYDLAEVHFPWLLDAGNSTMGAVLRILPFGIMQAGAMRAILIEKRRAKAEAAAKTDEPEFQSKRAPANQDSPPPAPTDPAAFLDAEQEAA